MKYAKMEKLEKEGSAVPSGSGEKPVSEPAILYQEDEMSSPYVDTHHESSDSNSDITLHSHNFYEMLYCRNVVDVEYLVGAERYRLQRGDIIFITPGISHRPLLPERLQAPYHRDVIWLDPDFVEQLKKMSSSAVGMIPDQPFLLRTAGTRWEYLGDLFRWGVVESEKKDPGWEMVVLGNSVQLLVHLNRALLERTAEPLQAEKPELLDQVMDYIESHLGEKITLGDVARNFYISQSTITQTFRNKMGVSFYRCVTQRRLIAAKRLIESGLPMDHISEHVGFKDYSSFYRAFKQEYGISPRQYRTMQAKLQK